MIIPIELERLKQEGIFFKLSTVYQWHSTGRYPKLFRKIGGRLFIETNEWGKIVSKSKQIAYKQAKILQIKD